MFIFICSSQDDCMQCSFILYVVWRIIMVISSVQVFKLWTRDSLSWSCHFFLYTKQHQSQDFSHLQLHGFSQICFFAFIVSFKNTLLTKKSQLIKCQYVLDKTSYHLPKQRYIYIWTKVVGYHLSDILNLKNVKLLQGCHKHKFRNRNMIVRPFFYNVWVKVWKKVVISFIGYYTEL